MEEIRVEMNTEISAENQNPTPRAGLICGLLCISGILFC